MIHSREELREFIEWDGRAQGRTKVSPKIFGDETWKFQITMRKLDYYHYLKSIHPIAMIPYAFYRYIYHQLSVKLGFTIPYNVCGKGLAIPHYGSVLINHTAHIGDNCRILDGVNIGARSGTTFSSHPGQR